MVGGNYLTIFRDDGSDTRKIFYALENLGIFTLQREYSEKKVIDGKEVSFYNYSWHLTVKGQRMIRDNESLEILLSEKDFHRFYEEIKKILSPKEKTDFDFKAP